MNCNAAPPKGASVWKSSGHLMVVTVCAQVNSLGTRLACFTCSDLPQWLQTLTGIQLTFLIVARFDLLMLCVARLECNRTDLRSAALQFQHSFERLCAGYVRTMCGLCAAQVRLMCGCILAAFRLHPGCILATSPLHSGSKRSKQR